MEKSVYFYIFVNILCKINVCISIYINARIFQAIAHKFASRKPASSGTASLEGEAAEMDVILGWHVLSVGVYRGMMDI